MVGAEHNVNFLTAIEIAPVGRMLVALFASVALSDRAQRFPGVDTADRAVDGDLDRRLLRRACRKRQRAAGASQNHAKQHHGEKPRASHQRAEFMRQRNVRQSFIATSHSRML